MRDQPSRQTGADFCVEALKEAIVKYGKPEIFNSDQGSQFTLEECLWWTVKHEWVYLRPAANGIEQKRSLVEFFDWYNRR